MKPSYSVKSNLIGSQSSRASTTSMLGSPSGLFARQGILQRKPKANILDKNHSHQVGITSLTQCCRTRSSKRSSSAIKTNSRR